MIDLRILAGGELAIMTAFATVAHAGVIKHAGGETADDMAYGTVFGGGNMIRRLADGHRAVMAGGAVIHDTGMVEHRGEKTAGHVTHTAIFSSG